MARIILHVDMDCFFASVEIVKNPKLKGKPLVIGADPRNGKGRGVVSTCSMEARKYGIHSAMPISRAYKLCPKATFLRPNFKIYSKASKNVMKILRNYSSRFQQTSIDEAFLDITEKVHDSADAKIIAYKIKNEIFKKYRLTCSIGIANNKLVAKIASDHNKPEGLVVVEDNKKFLEKLPIRKLYGVGPKTETKLNEFGIRTIGQLASYNKEKLIKRFGIYGIYLSLSANGIGSDFISEDHGRLSIGRENTFMHDVGDFRQINNAIDDIADEIAAELREDSRFFKTAGIKVRLHNFKTYTRAKTLTHLSNEKGAIINISKNLAQEFKGNKIRLIGVRVSNLEEFKHQKTIGEFI